MPSYPKSTQHPQAREARAEERVTNRNTNIVNIGRPAPAAPRLGGNTDIRRRDGEEKRPPTEVRRQPPREERVPQKPRREDTHQGHGGHAASGYPEGPVNYVKHGDSQLKPLDHHTAAKPRPLTPRDPRKEEVAACRLTLSEALDPTMSRPLKRDRADEAQHSNKRKIAQAGQPTVQSGEDCEREWPQDYTHPGITSALLGLHNVGHAQLRAYRSVVGPGVVPDTPALQGDAGEDHYMVHGPICRAEGAVR